MAGFDVKKARADGYSDDEILGELSRTTPGFNAQQAIKDGYSKQEIIDHLSGGGSDTSSVPLPPHPGPAPLPSIKLGPVDRAWNAFKEFAPPAAAPDWPELGPQFRQQVSNTARGIAAIPGQSWDSLVKAGKAMTNLDPSGTAYHIAGAVPLFGPQAQQITSDVGAGNYPEAVGHAAGMYLPTVLPSVEEGGNAIANMASDLETGIPAFKQGVKQHLATAPPSKFGRLVGRGAGAYLTRQATSALGLPSDLGGIVAGGYYGGEAGETLGNLPAAVKAGLKRSVEKIQQSRATGRIPARDYMLPPPPEEPLAPVQGAQPGFPSGRVPGNVAEREPVPPRSPVWEGQVPTPPPAPPPPTYGPQPGFPSGRLPGHLTEPPAPPPPRVPVWDQGQQPAPQPEPLAPLQGPQQGFPSGRTPGHLVPSRMELIEAAKAKIAGGEPLTPGEKKLLADYTVEQKAAQAKATAAAAGASPQPEPQASKPMTPPPAGAATTGSASSSTDFGEKTSTDKAAAPGIQKRYAEMKGDTTLRDAAIAKDLVVAQHLMKNEVTPEGWLKLELGEQNKHVIAAGKAVNKNFKEMGKGGSLSRKVQDNIQHVYETLKELYARPGSGSSQ